MVRDVYDLGGIEPYHSTRAKPGRALVGCALARVDASANTFDWPKTRCAPSRRFQDSLCRSPLPDEATIGGAMGPANRAASTISSAKPFRELVTRQVAQVRSSAFRLTRDPVTSSLARSWRELLNHARGSPRDGYASRVSYTSRVHSSQSFARRSRVRVTSQLVPCQL